MTHTDIPLAPAIRRMVDLLTDAAWRGRRALIAQYGTPADMRRSNARGFADLSRALGKVRLLQRLLRYVFVILAAWLEAPVRKTRDATPPAQPVRDDVHARVRRMALALPLRAHVESAGPQPAALAHAVRDPLRLLATHLGMLTDALLDPMPYIRRLAQRLRRDVCYVGWRVPKRAPPLRRRYLWEELNEARAQVRLELREQRWRRADSS